MYYLFLISLLLVMLVYILFIVVSYKVKYDFEIISPYECGFNPNSFSRLMFSYRFFLISILFLVFDVEIALMLPVPYLMKTLLGVWLFFMFILILILGLLYEYYYGSLEWLS